MSTTTADGFCGWIRTKGKRWERAIESDTHDNATTALLAHAETVPGVHRDLVVLAAGVDPNHRSGRQEGR